MPAKCCVDRWERLLEEDPDMPVFTLLAKDNLAVPVVTAWLVLARNHGVNEGKIAKAQEHLDALIAYRREHPDKMQLPD